MEHRIGTPKHKYIYRSRVHTQYMVYTIYTCTPYTDNYNNNIYKYIQRNDIII